MVRIPRSSKRRGEPGYAKLLSHVDLDAQSGFEFQGTFLRAGDSIPESALWPSPQYPKVPVILEFAGSIRSRFGHNRSPWLYVLWRYQDGEWFEVARMAAHSNEWCAVLAPVAASLINQDRAKPVAVDALADRIRHLIEAEIQRASPEDRAKVATIVHDQLALRLLNPRCFWRAA